MRPRLRDQGGEEVRLPCPTLSEPLCCCARFWANRLSYGDVARLTQQMAGCAVLSEDGIWRLVHKQAQALDAQQLQAIQEAMDLEEPQYVAVTDLYAPPGQEAGEEFVVLTDGIGVKAQKPTRQRKGEPRPEKGEKRHDTDVLILPRPDGREQVLCEGISARWSLVEAARAFLKREWSGATLSVVALTDGAKVIRADLSALFGEGVRIVLDWYHLEKRVYQQLSMAAHSMKEREAWERQVLGFVWRGKVAQARAFLSGLVVRSATALADLLGYLDKHETEIIDYELRQQAGKPIGSGRMEKCVDQVIGHRHKGKGMSWTKAGSRALALLKVAELNARTA
jgi:hypothetical protein